MNKTEQLRKTLGRLSDKQATALAHAVEMQRTLGQEIVPTELVLDGIRSRLRDARPRRVPTLCRLVCAGFEDFLTDRQDEPRIEGLIPRKVIKPWWSAVRHVAGDEVAAFDVKLKNLLAADPPPKLDTFRQQAQQAAAGWTAAIVSELAKPNPDPELRKHLSGYLVDDARTIAKILPIAPSLASSMVALTRLLGRLGLMNGARITDLPPPGIKLLKQHYVALTESRGADARFLAFAVMNRLEKRCQILRLGRALSWKPNDTMVANTEFSAVGSRVIGDLQHLTRQIVVQTAPNSPEPEAEALARDIVNYMEEAEALLSEFGFRRGSAWGDAILKTRADLAQALSRKFLQRFANKILDLVPPSDDGRVDPDATPSSRTIDGAQAVRETVTAFGTEVDTRVSALLRILQSDPTAHADAIRAQITAVAEPCNLIFDDGRGHVLLRRLGNVLRARH